MSVWSSVDGYVVLDKHCGASIRKLIVSMFPEARPNVIQDSSHTNGKILVKFAFNFSDGAIDAALQIQTFVGKIKEFDNKSIIEIDSKIRFIA